jgi:hypothetical protein
MDRCQHTNAQRTKVDHVRGTVTDYQETCYNRNANGDCADYQETE